MMDAKTSPPTTVDDLGADSLPDVLTVDELAALLRVERKTAYGAIARGGIPGVRRIGKVYRISREAVMKWLAEGDQRRPRCRKIR